MKMKNILIPMLMIAPLMSSSNVLALDINNRVASAINSEQTDDINNWMPDKNVQNTVRISLGLSSSSQITKDMMNQLNTFTADSEVFKSFDGLQYAHNLTKLSLVNCQLPENFQLSFFAEHTPNLTELRISNCNLVSANLTGYISFYHINKLDFSNNQITGTMSDFNQIGSFMTAEEVNLANNQLSGGLPFEFPDGIPGIKVKQDDVTIKVNGSWDASDNFISAQDLTGNPISYNQLVVSGEVDPTTPGIYEVIYKQDFHNTWHNYSYKKLTVNVITDLTLKVKNTTLFKGDTWKPTDNFDSATNQFGKSLTVDDLTIKGADLVDTKIPGIYKVNYQNGTLEETTTVTVEDYILGDINRDGLVNEDDLVAFADYLNTGKLPTNVTEEYIKHAGNLDTGGTDPNAINEDDYLALIILLNNQ
ncbi:bacterial Ig-like domain-containing protein [Lactococcus carnosus]|uniref:Ig-like domain-containing protein n=1 Tax=Pseudolactococcus carnosus TaxID=2749961 RepID=A0ABT0AS81_9LACT|nr:bacterial Ig-like domain-containing protein [Lactococcus carnosus]MCJ1969243.1 hypothetical protein [Lactococcus carnosus]MCJ1989580.1 hypothetical protein [Lactococcus carnosus]MCJ1991211.1 hypothetical protein [Lactococcus carnosus]